jgi:hypothetical protein
MSSKLSLSLIAALSLSVVATRVAHAAPMADSRIDSAEAGNPNSIDYGSRMTPSRPASNDDIDAAERGNPESPDYNSRPPLAPDANTAAEWQSLESANPHHV